MKYNKRWVRCFCGHFDVSITLLEFVVVIASVFVVPAAGWSITSTPMRSCRLDLPQVKNHRILGLQLLFFQ
jgi:hypothetical protein